MTDPRSRTLRAIRASLGVGTRSAEQTAALEERLRRPAAGIVPARARLEREPRVQLFVKEATRVDATADRVAGPDAVPGAVAAYLARHNLPSVLRMAPDPALRRIPWSAQPTLAIAEGRAEAGDLVGLSGAFAGVAETGTLVLLSGPTAPTTLNFLPDTHVVVLEAERIVGTYEDVWTRIRAAADGGLPRTVNWITGPSRSADIEQTLLLGAHGPRRLHIVIVDGG